MILTLTDREQADRSGEGRGWRREMTHFNLFWNKQVITSEKDHAALAGVAQWIERQPANQKVPGSIPSQGICLGCRSGPQWNV